MVEERVPQLDGLRGVAALMVVFSHLVGALWPTWIPGGSSTIAWISHTPLRTLYDGSLAVDIFFVLSGYVIAQSSAKRKMPLYLQVPGRYLRLTLPMIASVVFAALLLSAFPHAIDGMRIAGDNIWLDTFYTAPPTSNFFRILSEPSIDTYRGHKSVLNPVLWTMRYELWGTCGLYLLYALSSGRWRQLALVAAGVALAATGRTQYLDFIIGAAFFELGRPNVQLRHLAGLLIPIGFVAAGPYLSYGPLDPFRYSLCASFIVFGVLHSVTAAKALSAGWAQHLGYVSFPLYLLHFPLLFTIFAVIFPHCATPLSVLAAAAAYILSSLGIANVFARWIDDPVVRGVKSLQRLLLRRSPAAPPGRRR